VRACLAPRLVQNKGLVQGLVFEMGVPVSDCDLIMVEEGEGQHSWPVVIDWVRGEYVGGVGQAKVCCVADVD